MDEKKKNDEWHMDKNIFNIIWTLLCFIFIGVITIFFNNAWFLLLLIIWLIRYYVK